ncbi:hypothetical protein VST7929_01509 [Vibrio stylophorae]|uniref:Aminoglycoside phosphotransferase domain-containing protein n=1 Tax=Vibrio stylophorae TaxID=659351 RepID=A0ABM8ZTI8_9VIBR|nr:aminoglycoside phosphotransferase family protein [Vibrio stylophorae]CAH0533638.1 hypothetical protein VST7929_01509 [Vibrio stylophorae]
MTKVHMSQHTVLRAANSSSPTVHYFLTYLQSSFPYAPKPLGFEWHDGQKMERLTLVPGTTYDYPLQGAIASEQALVSAAMLLRQFHDASADYIDLLDDEMIWLLPARQPAEVICHGDFAPYNVTCEGENVVGVYDFDTAHPAPRVWDLAYAIYCWAPFKTHEVDRLGDLDAQIERALIFANAYGMNAQQRAVLLNTMIERLHCLVAFMKAQSEQGDDKFSMDIAQGHSQSYLNDIVYLQTHRAAITARLMAAL